MRKILVIDDHQSNLISIKATIESFVPDCEIIITQSAREGFVLAQKEAPDIILLDVVMPEMDGYTMCRELKADARTKQIYVILISTFQTNSDSKVKGFGAGADAYLTRPIEQAELAAHLTAMLRIKRTEQQLQEALEKANESDRLKSVFLATMSHELRTPLNAIIGFSSLLDPNTSRKEVEQYARTIHDNGNHLLRLVEDLFDITLIESGELKLKKEEVSVRELLEDLEEIAKGEQIQLAKDKINILIDPICRLYDHRLITDSSRFKQIMVNLIKNALKFTQEGTIEFGYREEKMENRQQLTFFVKDTGIGISPEIQKLIFEPFLQAEDTYTRSYNGAGIGLFISKQLATLLGGEMWLESKEGAGSTFYFTIPNPLQKRKSSVYPSSQSSVN